MERGNLLRADDDDWLPFTSVFWYWCSFRLHNPRWILFEQQSKLIANFYLFPHLFRSDFHPFEYKKFLIASRACNFLHLLLMEKTVSRLLLLLLFCAINQMIFAMLVTATIYKCNFNWKTFFFTFRILELFEKFQSFCKVLKLEFHFNFFFSIFSFLLEVIFLLNFWLRFSLNLRQIFNLFFIYCLVLWGLVLV